jgi:hypothetical protein
MRNGYWMLIGDWINRVTTAAANSGCDRGKAVPGRVAPKARSQGTEKVEAAGKK